MAGASTEQYLESVLDGQASLADAFRELSDNFAKLHYQYFTWLRNEFENILRSDKVVQILEVPGVDWLTLHYATRHSREEDSSGRDWLQLGVPLSDAMSKHQAKLLVHERSTPPYLAFQGEVVRAQPVVIYLLDGSVRTQPVAPNVIHLGNGLCNYLAQITETREAQGEPDEDQIELCRHHAGPTWREISERVRMWVSTAESSDPPSDGAVIGLLRNACRVSFLALQVKDKYICLPRFVVLAPIFTDRNLIGGIAFIGNDKVESSGLSPVQSRALYLLAHSLLTGVRLREEPHVVSQARQAEELNRARAEFVQRITHSLQSPIESLLLNLHGCVESVGKSVASLQGSLESLLKIEERVLALKDAAGSVMSAFSHGNPDALLRIRPVEIKIYEFVETLLFMNRTKYEKKKKSLTCPSSVDKGWRLWADKPALWEVMDNLLNNACRFSRSKVELLVEQPDEGTFRLTVRDDNEGGVDLAVLPHLFEPGSGKTADPTTGEVHGYGLYLSKKIIEKHGGKMYLGATSPEGSSFVVEVPVGRPT